jgi:hypothetical protein
VDPALATFKGKEASTDKNPATGKDKVANSSGKEHQQTSKDKRPAKEGLCGRHHDYDRCFYLIESIRPADWKPIAAIMKEIQAALDSYPRGYVDPLDPPARFRAKGPMYVAVMTPYRFGLDSFCPVVGR